MAFFQNIRPAKYGLDNKKRPFIIIKCQFMIEGNSIAVRKRGAYSSVIVIVQHREQAIRNDLKGKSLD